MITKDHSYIQEATCAKFPLDNIKEAFSVLFKYVNPSEKFRYQGPNNSTIRQKSVHAFNEIFKLLQKLDNEAKSPIIACPSEELRLVLPPNSQTDYTALDNRIRQLEHDMTRVNHLESTVSAHSQMLHANSPHPSANLTAGTAVSRLQSESIIRSRSPSVSSIKRKERSGSEDSDSSDDELSSIVKPKCQSKDKRQKLHDVNGATGMSSLQLYPSLPANDGLLDGFEFDKHQKRRIRKNDAKKSVTTVKPSTPATPGDRRRFQFVQGKDDSEPDNFCGIRRFPRVPQAFIYRCDSERSTEDGVNNHLKARGISVSEVKQVSAPDSRFKSFKVTVNKLDDYNLLLTGSHIPKSCRVRKFIPPRSDLARNQGFFRSWEASWDPISSDTDAISFKRNLDDLASLQVATSDSAKDSSAMETADVIPTITHTSSTDVQSDAAQPPQVQVDINIQARNSNGSE